LTAAILYLRSFKTFLDFSENANNKQNLKCVKVINAYGGVLLSQKTSRLNPQPRDVEKNLNEISKIFENGLTEEEDVEQLQL
jgi:hypothetical protein